MQPGNEKGSEESDIDARTSVEIGGREREFIYQVHNIDNTYQLLQCQAASGGISPS